MSATVATTQLLVCRLTVEEAKRLRELAALARLVLVGLEGRGAAQSDAIAALHRVAAATPSWGQPTRRRTIETVTRPVWDAARAAFSAAADHVAHTVDRAALRALSADIRDALEHDATSWRLFAGSGPYAD